MSEDVPLLPSRHGRKTSSRSSSSSSSSASAPNGDYLSNGPAPQLLTNFDQALSHLGTYGPWQIVVVGLLWLPAVAAGVIVLLWSFTGLEPKYIYLNFRETIRETLFVLRFNFQKGHSAARLRNATAMAPPASQTRILTPSSPTTMIRTSARGPC